MICLQTFWAFSPVPYKLDPKRVFYWVPLSLLFLLFISKNILILDSLKRWRVCHDYTVWTHFQQKKVWVFRPTVCKPEMEMQWSRERIYCEFDFYGNSVIFFKSCVLSAESYRCQPYLAMICSILSFCFNSWFLRSLWLCVSMYMYIHVHILGRERHRDRDRKREGERKKDKTNSEVRQQNSLLFYKTFFYNSCHCSPSITIFSLQES